MAKDKTKKVVEEEEEILGARTSTSTTTPTGTSANQVQGIAAQDAAVSGNPTQIAVEAADFDGSALPSSVGAEGDIIRPKASLSGVQYVMLVNEDGSAQPTYDVATDAGKGFEISPVSSHHVEETLAAVTNGADDTYYYYVDMDSYGYASFQMTLSGGSGTCTVTAEASNQDDGTAPASCAYQDVTQALFGVASTTASSMWIADTPIPFKYLRLKVVASTGDADDADWTIYSKKMF